MFPAEAKRNNEGSEGMNCFTGQLPTMVSFLLTQEQRGKFL